MKTIAKILFAIAILWTLAFVFKIGNSFALSPEYKKEIYNNCYQDSKTSLGKKRAKQYCKCTSTMLDNKYSDEDILNIGQKSEAEQIEAFKFATNYCNKNANASSDVEMSKKIEETSNNIINFNKCYRIDWASNKGDPMKNFNSFDEMTEKFPVEEEKVGCGLRQVKLQGRWQVLPGKPMIILDACHNQEGAAALRGNLLALGKTVEVWFGSLGEDRASEVIQAVLPFSYAFRLFRPNQPRACSIQSLLELIPDAFDGAISTGKIDCVDEYFARADKDRIILITGSIYLLGEILSVVKNFKGNQGIELQDLV